MDVKTRKILTMNGVLNRCSNVDRLYMKRKVGGRGLISVQECVKSEELGLCEYVRSSEEWMLKVVGDGMVKSESQLDYKKRMADKRMVKLKEKKLQGKFFNEVKEVASVKSWDWMRSGSLFKRTEAYVCAAQENVLKTRNYCVSVMGKKGSNMCRMCGGFAETVGHVRSCRRRSICVDMTRWV